MNKSKWHNLNSENIFEISSTSRNGLSADEANQRLHKNGKNVLSSAKKESNLILFLKQINHPLIYILLLSTFLTLSMGMITDAIAIAGIILVNSIIGFAQEVKANSAMDALTKIVSYKAKVIRDGTKKEIDATEVVEGDIVLLESGDKVPADLRLFECQSLKVDESMLTGESLPVEKSTSNLAEETLLADRKNMAFSGSYVTYGRAQGVVIATGMNTEIGAIAHLLENAGREKTPLAIQLEKVGKSISVKIMLFSVLFFVVAYFRDYGIVNALLLAITLSVAAIPEGLPTIVSIVLSVAAKRMAKRRAIVRKLEAVETLGCASVICTDKTGTLTKNEMQVLKIEGSDHLELIRAGILCNEATLEHGDPTEIALLSFAEKNGLSTEDVRSKWKRISFIPFESHQQWMASLHFNNKYVAYIKGAPEKIALFCKLDIDILKPQINALATDGLRVLAFARADWPAIENPSFSAISYENISSSEIEWKFLGLQAMMDPPRPEAIDAVAKCQSAGIEIKMITGDHPQTAAAIGKQLSIGLSVITGKELAKASDSEISKWSKEKSIFARVAPENKLAIVKALQESGEVVAMTGDGVNDAPALKQADIGISMGITGTAVAQQASDIVLMDDNFATIKAAVEEGRRAYDNIVKSMIFLLPTNLGEALILLFSILFFPKIGNEILVPISTVQILWVNMVASITLGLTLAFEDKEPDVMLRPPRQRNTNIINRSVLIRTFYVAIIMAFFGIALFLYEFYQAQSTGIDFKIALQEAQTMTANTIVLFQIFYLLECRSIRFSFWNPNLGINKAIPIGIFSLIILQLAFTYLPSLQNIFHTTDLSWQSQIKCIFIAFIIIPIVSLEKWFGQNYHHTKSKLIEKINELKKIKDDPEKLARGVGVGFFWGVSPLWGLQIIAAVFTAKIIRGNILLAAAMTAISNPITNLPLYTFCYIIGNWIIGGTADTYNLDNLIHLETWKNLGPHFIYSITIGTIVVGLLGGVVCYYLTKFLLTRSKNKNL
ncbi:MAG: HAD-IC family P-type ATPase [Oligoflexia bacterium]|nr:HAD-IC family P-type ATPase [Oligoflexia bacterium]